MQDDRFPGGVWPVMLTPFKLDGTLDEACFKPLVDWYIDQGSDGLFAICQSSEMYQMTLDERVQAVRAIVKAADGRVPVIASAAICENEADWLTEITETYAAGAQAIVLITNQFARPDEDDATWLRNCMKLVDRIPNEIPLGFYECPYPYKQLIATRNLSAIAQTGRFYFLKDTCCDEKLIEERLEVINGTNLKLYNANTTTLLPSMRAGAAGFSGVMANFHTSLYARLYAHRNEAAADDLQAFLTVASIIERQYYPVNAKYHMNAVSGVPMTPFSRRQDWKGLTDTYKREVNDLARMEKLISDTLLK